MAGTFSNFQIYDTEFFSGMTESVEQAAIEMNAGSGGTLILRSNMHRGDFEKQSFFNRVEGLISRRDNGSVAPVDDLEMGQGELVAVKINSKIGPVAQTIDAFKKIAQDPRLMSFQLGSQYGEDYVLDMLNSSLLAVVTAMETVPAMVVDIADSDAEVKTLSHLNLVKGMAAMGDRASRVKALVMHSKSFFDLIGDAIASQITNVADVTIYSGTTGSLGRPILVTDSTALQVTEMVGDPGEEVPTVVGYRVVGLTEGATDIAQSEENTIVSEIVTGRESLFMRYQGETAHTVGVKGFAFTGTANPSDEELGDGSNWDYVYNTHKNGPGFVMLVE